MLDPPPLSKFWHYIKLFQILFLFGLISSVFGSNNLNTNKRAFEKAKNALKRASKYKKKHVSTMPKSYNWLQLKEVGGREVGHYYDGVRVLVIYWIEEKKQFR